MTTNRTGCAVGTSQYSIITFEKTGFQSIIDEQAAIKTSGCTHRLRGATVKSQELTVPHSLPPTTFSVGGNQQ